MPSEVAVGEGRGCIHTVLTGSIRGRYINCFVS